MTGCTGRAEAQTEEGMLEDLGFAASRRNFSTSLLESDFGYYVILSAAKDVRDFKRRIGDEIGKLGFTEYTFVRLSCADSEVDVKELCVISPELLHSYYSAGLYEHDLGFSYAKKNTSPIFRSTIHDYVIKAPFNLEQAECMKEICALNQYHGYYEFFNVPLKARNGNGQVMLTVTQRGAAPRAFKTKVEECYTQLQLLCDAIDFVQTQKFADVFLGREIEENKVVNINPKPLRVLYTLANNDFTIGQVADELCISVVTANKHLESVRRAFGARTNYSAIKQAVQSGLIRYEK